VPREQCTFVVGRDVTELKKSQQLFQGVLQSAPDAMVLIDPSGRMVMVNRQTERVFGYASGEMLGQPVEMLLPERFRARHVEHVAGFFTSSDVRPMGARQPLLGLRKDGTEFPVDVSLSPIATESGKLVAAAVRDVSDRKPL
jgi:protein-histidine pros-kinase